MSATAWYVARSGGIVAFLLLSASVALGLLMAGRRRLGWPRFAVEALHRYLSILTAAFIVLHGAALLLDRVVSFSLVSELVPFTSSYRPFAVGIGVLSAELLAAIGVTNALRSRLPRRLWRRVHYLTFVVWAGSVTHVLLVGTDRRDGWLLAVVALAVCSVAMCGLARVGRGFGPAGVAAGLAASIAAVLALAFTPQAPAAATTNAANPAGVSHALGAAHVTDSLAPGTTAATLSTA